jgi:HK97 family phage prohead protease
MTKDIKFLFESKVALGIKNDEALDTTGLIEATVTTWGAREGADGRKFNYQPEGFAQWADEFAKSGKPLPMYFQHNDMSMPVGEWQEFSFTDETMEAKGRLFTNTTAGKDLYTIMKESPNMVGGVSVGAYADEYKMVDADGMDDDSDEAYFQITKGGLREVSIVMQPNNLECNISKLECFRADGSLDLKLIEKALRDAKLSRKDATTASSIFKQILATRDEPKVEVEKAPIQSDADAVVNEEDQLLKAFEERELLKKLNNRLKG